eukprot:gene23949-10075_t
MSVEANEKEIVHPAPLGRRGRIIRMLIQAGVDINSMIEGETCLMTACRKGQLSAIELLLQAGADASVSEGWMMWTPTMEACCKGHSPVIEMLLQAGAAVNASEIGNYTALMFACRHGKFNVVELLLQAGADTTVDEDGSGRTSVLFACRHGYSNMVDIL